jgi:hypothetical protein
MQRVAFNLKRKERLDIHKHVHRRKAKTSEYGGPVFSIRGLDQYGYEYNKMSNLIIVFAKAVSSMS